VFRAKAGDEGKLFGSVTSQDIQQALLAKGFELDRRQILLEEPIKTIGAHEATVRIFQDIATTVRVLVEPE
jgi:large subunit ribosomal protein L9